MAYSEDELYDMSDEQLEAAMTEEVAEMASPEIEVVPEVVPEVAVEQLDEGLNSAEPEVVNTDDGDEVVAEVPAEAGDANVVDETVVETDSKDIVPVAEPVVRKFKANGQEFEFTEQEMIQQFGKVFGQSMDYTKKMQTIAPYRKMISAIEDEGLKEQDMNLMIDAFKGDKGALNALMERTGVNALELDAEEENNYVPNDYGRSEMELRLNEVIDTIKDDVEFATTQNVVSNQWDDKSRDSFAENPQLIKELHIDVQNGTYDKVSPLATKLKVLDGGRRSDIDYYVEAGRQYHTQARSVELQGIQAEARLAEQTRLEAVKAASDTRKQVRADAESRKAATIPKKRVGESTVTDYLEDNDEAFDEWYAKLQESM